MIMSIKIIFNIYFQKWREVELEELLPDEEDLISQIDSEDWNLFRTKERTKPF